MTDAIVSGALAGYAIAIPVGAMAVLVVDAGLTAGFRTGVAAGLGVASADLLYAVVAAFAGAAIAALLEPWESALALASAAVLAGFAVMLALRARRLAAAGPATAPPSRPERTYARFLGLTIVNPPTIALFAAIVVGMGADALPGVSDRGAFALAVFLASASWQTLLALVGAAAHRHLPDGARVWASLAGAGVIALLAVRTALGA
jgi:threonine/homoserine/homoserine lactone efflux protein